MTRRQDWVNIKVPRETRDQLRMVKEEFNYSSYADFIQESIDLRMKEADITPTESFDHIGFRMACLSNRMDATLEDFDDMWPTFRQDIKELQEENSVEAAPKG